jgi:hypothetical protein
VRRAFILGSASAAWISLLSLSMISAGVFLGTAAPYHAFATCPPIKSVIAGPSPRWGMCTRSVPVARARPCRAGTVASELGPCGRGGLARQVGR